MRNAGPANQPGLSARTQGQGPGGNLQFESEKGLVEYKQNIRGLLGLSAALVLSIMINVLQGGRRELRNERQPPANCEGSSLGQRNGGVPTWVDLAGIDPRDQTQGI